MDDHIRFLEKKAIINRTKLFNVMGKENALDYIYELELEEKPEWFKYSAVGMELRARLGKDEAFSLINLLSDSAINLNSDTKLSLEWSYFQTINNQNVKKVVSKEMTHIEMIKRLEEITYEDYGDDMEKWNRWMAFRKEFGFWRTR